MKKNSEIVQKLCVAGSIVAIVVAGIAASLPKRASVEGLPNDAVTATGTAKGMDGDVTVEVTATKDKIYAINVTDQHETEGIGTTAVDQLPQKLLDSQDLNVDGISGATVTSDAIKQAVRNALDSAGIDASAFEGSADAGAAAKKEISYTPGTYTGKARGYNGEVALDVTFSDNAIKDIKVNASNETNHVGTPAYDIMFKDAIEANGSGIDSVSGATFTSAAVKAALNDAAEQAKASDLDAFKNNTVKHEAQKPIEETYDVVVVGAGGAGMGAAVQAAQNGEKVLVMEENAEIGGNTLVSGGAFQSVMPYLVWDPKDPDAKTAVWDYNGQTYDKVMSTQGCIDTLKIIENWSEKPFDADYYKTHDYVAGDIEELSKHGVHEEYLPTLQALKKETKEYLDWAQPQLDAGKPENEITLFSTVNLHIFQTYYGGLRQSSDKSEWIYGNYDLVSQFINDGQGLKEWLEDQGAMFDDASQPTLIGALWYRENQFGGGDLDGDGKAEVPAQWGTYFATTENTLLKKAPTAKDNKIMLRTKAESLIVEDGKVTGVAGKQYDGTEVKIHAKKGVILATGGYAANIQMVKDTNKYWDPKYITDNTKTTNRSSLQGDGIKMGEDAGASTEGTGWTQMMPISWIDNGNLAFGAGTYAVYINPTTGKRFVNESAERDVLSLGEFENGVEVNGAQGVFLEISNADVMVGRPYPYDDYKNNVSGKETVDGRVYFASSKEELGKILDNFGMKADPAVIYDTIEQYDKAIMAGKQPPEVKKSQASNIIGAADKDAKDNYDASTYKLDGVKLRVRVMAPSTHHTMGGLSIDTDRHVLTADGKKIAGLYAAGEVTGGIHGGNRLGGNAIVEIFVSGRTAANAIEADFKEKAANAAPVTFKAGEYEGSAQGKDGEVKVKVTLSDKAIEKVEVTEQQETQGIADPALEKIPAAIVDQQSTDVDSISGATITSDAIKAAAAAALASAGVDVDSLNLAAAAGGKTEQKKEDATYDTDVVIVGAGGAGMTAAIEASDAGKKVLILESQAMVGGNSNRAEGGMNAAGTKEQQKNKFEAASGVEKQLKTAKENWSDNKTITDLAATVQKQWDSYQKNPQGYFDTPELMELDTMIGGHGINDPALVKTLSENSADGIRWLDSIGASLPSVGQAGGASVMRIHRPLDKDGQIISVGSYVVPILKKNVDERGITVLTETTADKILTDKDGKAVGVEAKGSTGEKVTVNAKAVVITTGGFGANSKMVARYKPEYETFMTTNAPGAQGQGIDMATAVGADTVDMDQIQIHPTVLYGSGGTLVTEGLRGDGAILVNQKGERFTDEVGTRDVVSKAEIEQEGGYAYLIVDQKMADASKIIKRFIESKDAVKGDSIEDLAGVIGADKGTLAATIDKWNGYVKDKKDPDFGRTSFTEPLATAPYYALKVTPGVHHTMGGLKINTDAQVLNKDGKPISGLFAAGEVTGGVHGGNRLGGTAVTDFTVFGRIAGKSAAAYVK